MFWFFLLGGLLGIAAEAAGIAQPWRALLVLAVLAAVFLPLVQAAVVETRQLRAEGIELPSYPVTRKSLISAAVITGALWVIYGVAVVMNQDQFVFPLLPIAGTIWLAFLPPFLQNALGVICRRGHCLGGPGPCSCCSVFQ